MGAGAVLNVWRDCPVGLAFSSKVWNTVFCMRKRACLSSLYGDLKSEASLPFFKIMKPSSNSRGDRSQGCSSLGFTLAL